MTWPRTRTQRTRGRTATRPTIGQVQDRPLTLVPGYDRRADDPVSKLSRHLNDACTAAVTPHQIAALLEAEGLNDRIVAERYDRPGVFPLAVELYERVPLRRTLHDAIPPPDEAAPVPQGSTLSLIMRGPLYLAPLVFFLAAGDVIAGAPFVLAGLVALLLSWAWNQGFGALTHRLLGRGDLPGARLVARRAMLLGIGAVTLTATAVTSVAYTPSVDVVAFAAAQSAYLIGSAALLVFGRPGLLFALLAPGLAVSSAALVSGRVPSALVFAVIVATPVVVAVVAVLSMRNRRKSQAPTIGAKDWSVAMTQALLGFTWALVIGLAAVAAVGSGSVIASVSIGAAGMVLTMGVAEWQLVVVRRWAKELMIESRDPRQFGAAMRGVLVRAMVAYAAAVTAATAVVMAIARSADALTDVGVMLAVGFGLLGLAFFGGLVLVATNHLFIPFGGAFVLLVAVGAALTSTSLPPDLSVAIYATGCGGLCLATVAASLVLATHPVVHR